MKYGRYGKSHLLMSWGLGATFLWIGLDIIFHPANWVGFVPQNVPFGISREHAIFLGGIADVALGAFLILRWWEKLVALLVALHLLGILIFNGIDAVLIRDVGLLGTALALVFWPTKYRKHRLAKFFDKFRRNSSAHTEE